MNVDRLIAVLQEAGYQPHSVEGGRELTIHCRFCGDDKSRLYVSTGSGLWNCFRCSQKGHLFRLLRDVCGMTNSEAYTVERSIRGEGTARVFRTSLPRRTGLSSPVELPPYFQWVRDRRIGHEIAAEYAQARGVGGDNIRRYVGYCLAGYYHHRVVVPVYTEGQLRTWVARTWLKDEPKKVLTPKDSLASSAIFGYDIALRSPRVIKLVEGVLDALRMMTLGYTNMMATLGAHITPEQRRLLKRLEPESVVLLRDSDQAGMDAVFKESAELSSVFINCKVALLPDGTDPGSASPEDITTGLQGAFEIQTNYGKEVAKGGH